MVTAGVKEKGKKRSKSQKRADLLSVSPDAQDAEDPAHKAAKVSKDTAKGKKQKKSKERADASDQAPTSKKSKTVTDTEFTGQQAPVSKVAPPPSQYLQNPATMPTSRSVTTPVLTMNKMLLGEHSILIDDNSDAAVADILKATAAAAIVDKFHSADFQKLTIEQMGDAQIEINESVRTKMDGFFHRK
jgi:hypothetical protein